MIKQLLEQMAAKLENIFQMLGLFREFLELSDDGIKTTIKRKCDKFFRKMTFKGEALTFNDVRLRTCYSDVLPRDVVTKTKFSRNVWLNIPIVSAPMSDVTESPMAIALARLGGLGIINKRLSPERQAAEVKKVKHCLGAFLANPVCVNPEDTVEKVLKMKEQDGLKFWSFPVIDEVGKLIGMATRSYFDFCQNNQLSIGKIMSTEVISVDGEIGIDKAYKLMMEKKIRTLPVLGAGGELKGIYTLRDVKRIIHGDKADYNVGPDGSLCVGAAVSVGKDLKKRLELLSEAKVDVVVIDCAHGWTAGCLEALRWCKKKYPQIDVVAGNISEAGAALDLVKAGADGVRIGQGPGSICTTRIVAGIGTPQITAVYSCAKALRDYDIPCCADGGIKYSGDITLALGAGADNVMLGNALAGTTESPGELIVSAEGGTAQKRYRGEGSLGAMLESQASRERYGQKDEPREKLVPEGVEGTVPFKGDVAAIVYQLIGGLRSGMGYLGAKDISELHENADFYQMSSAGLYESHPHDLQSIKKAPNYQC